MLRRLEGFEGRAALVSQWMLFFCLLFYLLWKQVDLRIVYHGGGLIASFPSFYWGADFFRETLSQPGGWLQYLNSLLMQSFYHSWLGALVVTGQACLLSCLLRACLKSTGGSSLGLFALVPGVFLLALYARPTYSVAAVTVSSCALFALGMALLLLRIRFPVVALQCGAFLLGSALVYYVSPGSSLLFLLLMLLLCVRQRQSMVVLGVLVAGAVSLPLAIGCWGYGMSPRESYLSAMPFAVSSRVLQSAGLGLLYLVYFSAFVLGMIGWAWDAMSGSPLRGNSPASPDRAGEEVGKRGKAAPGGARTPRPGGVFVGVPLRAGEALALLLVTYGIWAISVDQETRTVMHVDYFAHHREWNRVLEAAQGDVRSIHVQCAVNQALFHLGRLGDDLLLTQNPEALLLYDHKFRPDWNVIDVYLDLGFVGMAHHYLVEAMDIYGERPSLLRRSVLVNLVLGNTGTARIYLRALAKVPFHRAWANQWLKEMESDTSMAQNKEVARLRELVMKKNQMVPLPMEKLMLSLLEANPRNRMAFEYLMAHYLITKNMQGFISQLGRLDQFTMGELPRLYQEAIVVGVHDLGLRPDLKKLRLGDEVLQRHQAFSAKLKSAGQGAAKVQADLQREFAGSYFYYYFSR